MVTFICRACALGATFLLITTFAGWSRPADASAISPHLLAVAIHNTDTVKTLQYTDETVQRFSNGVVTTVVQGQEDEARNRERDHETLIARIKGKAGKLQTRAYVVNVVFLNGQTYYERPLKDKTWHTKKGMSFKDGVSSFKRGRTTVTYGPIFNGVHLAPAGTASNGDARFQGHVSKKGVSGTVDVLVSHGKTPYVVLLSEAVTAHVKGQTLKTLSRVAYGPFNQPLNITAPLSSTL